MNHSPLPPSALGTLSFYVFTLFPEMFPGPLSLSCMGQGLKKGLWSLETVFLRNYGLTHHKNVDDTCYGGGSGMLLRADVLGDALDDTVKKLQTSTDASNLHQSDPMAIHPKKSGDTPWVSPPHPYDSQQSKRRSAGVCLTKNSPSLPIPPGPRMLYVSPKGRPLKQSFLEELSQEERPIFILCGRYEGLDQRVLDHYPLEEISLGDFILSGGEIAAMALMDGTLRLRPGILGNPYSTQEESFAKGLLEYPQYTKPRCWQGRLVPEILCSGHHAAIHQWRLEQSKALTKKRRPDLWQAWCQRINTQES
jgi:tRNA (guanine37-N1)-methyltransferase